MSNLRTVLPKTTVLRFAVEALVRSEQGKGKGSVPPPPTRDYEGYRAFRSQEQRGAIRESLATSFAGVLGGRLGS